MALTAKQEAFCLAVAMDGGLPYVYTLSDPSGAVFYVGKGRNRRVLQHVAAAKKGEPGKKNDRIRSILSEGGFVREQIVSVFDTDAEAIDEENRLLLAYTGLTNIAGPRRWGVSVREDSAEGMRRLLEKTVAMIHSAKPFAEWVNEKFRTTEEINLHKVVLDGLRNIELMLMEKMGAANAGG